MLTTARPATGPEKATVPAPIARAGEPGEVAYSSPRFPAPYGPSGARNGSVISPSTGGR